MGVMLTRGNLGQMPSHAVVTGHDVASTRPILCRTTEVWPSSHGVTRYPSRHSAVASAVNDGLYKHRTIEGTVRIPQDEPLRDGVLL